MNKERIFDAVMESFESEGFYSKISAQYRKKHGHYAFIDRKRGMSDEIARIADAGDSSRNDYYKVLFLFDLFQLDAEQIKRLYTASRFLRRWYERTEWQFCPSDDLINRLWDFVIG